MTDVANQSANFRFRANPAISVPATPWHRGLPRRTTSASRSCMRRRLPSSFFSAALRSRWSGWNCSRQQADLLSADTYNKLFTFHGVIMVWFFLVPSIPGTLGNFLLPLMIGARDVAFPRLNLFSWYLILAGGCCTLYALIAGGVDTGWTFYTPFSTMFSNTHVIAAALGVFIAGFSSIATGVNFIATTHMLRAPGMTWFRLPLFVWAIYATSLVMVLATPVLAITLLLVIAERWLRLPIFDPGSWRRSVAVPAPVLVLLAIPRSTSWCCRRWGSFRKSSRASPAAASSATTSWFTPWSAIAVIGFFVWGHHMFVSGPVALREHRLLVSVLHRRRAIRPSRCSIGRRRSIAARSASRRRCSMRWASWDCSRSAG